MYRCIVISMMSLTTLAGCMQPQMPMGDFKQPDPAPEMAKLAKFLGTWEGTAHFNDETADMMKSMAPEGEEMPNDFAGGGTYTWTLDGHFLKGTGWHEMGPDQKAQYVELWTWDAKEGKYKTWFYSDWGEYGTGTATWCEDNCLCVKSTGSDPSGATMKGEGCMRFTDDKTLDWNWSEKRGPAKMGFYGTSKKTN